MKNIYILLGLIGLMFGASIFAMWHLNIKLNQIIAYQESLYCLNETDN